MKILNLVKEEIIKKINETISDRDLEYSERRKLNKSWEGSNLQTDVQGKEAHAVLKYLQNEFNAEDISVYDIIPTDTIHYMTKFEVNNDEFEGMSFICGDESDVERTAIEMAKELIDDTGLDGFRESFLEDYIDKEKVEYVFRNIASAMIYDDVDEWINDKSKRELSHKQMMQVEYYEELVIKIDNQIRFIEQNSDESEKEYVERQTNKLIDKIDKYQKIIKDIEGNPEGDYPSELVERYIDNYVSDLMDDVTESMNEYGFDIKEYIDMDELAKGIVETDGYEHVLGGYLYDGKLEEYGLFNNYYFVGRVD